MSNRRKLRPHEVAKRDQRAAEMKERVGRGEGVIWVDDPEPGTQCCYCDCPLTSDSPHRQPGYVCDKPCPAEAVYLVLVLSVPEPHPLPLCSRHYEDWCADFAEIVRPAVIQFAEPWADDDYEGPPALWTPAT